MISGLLLLYGWKIYKKDYEQIGKENLVASWRERIMAWLICGFWAIDVLILIFT